MGHVTVPLKNGTIIIYPMHGKKSPRDVACEKVNCGFKAQK